MSQPSHEQLRSTLIRALKEVERLRAKVALLEGGVREPIAIVGIGMRLPGGVVDLSSLWTLLSRETDAITPFPDDRWDNEGLYDPDPESPGKTYVREAGFLEHIDRFDPAFFNISPREATSMDPQHRLLLEVAWEALEHAGIKPRSLVESRTGVFVGIGPSDYGLSIDPQTADTYAIMGTQTSFSAGRIAFHLGLQGPAISVDTACSSALVALHLAKLSLQSGESSLALVGGVQLMAGSDAFVQLARTRALAPDGRSKTFSANADGYGRGEGAVVLVLERLADARHNRHHVLALLRGTAVNHDGPSSGITAPNGTSQQKVLRAALADAGLDPTAVGYVECHGTGTSLGDPIEVNALAAVYGPGRPKAVPLRIGAIKPNIGHLEAASGLASVAKLLTILVHDGIPATIHSTPRNPFIDWHTLPIQVVDTLSPWPRHDHPRQAATSAFGLSGTNAHIIIEEPPVEESEPEPAHQALTLPLVPLLLSGRSPEALRQQAAALREQLLRERPRLIDLAWSLAQRRTHFEVRGFVLCRDIDDAIDQLEAMAEGRIESTRIGKSRPKLAMLFTGQGAQRAGMGQQLHDLLPSFRTHFLEICERLDPLLEHPLASIVFAAPDSAAAAKLDQTQYTQVALFALEVALFRQFQSWGIEPDYLLGHSIGELAAAHVLGLLDLDDACRLVAARGQLMQALPSGGAMFSIRASEQELLPALEAHPGVDIAGLNGPASTVLAGDDAALRALALALGRDHKRLTVSHAFHSRHMEPMLEPFRRQVEALSFRPPVLAAQLISNVTGELAQASQLSSPEYWVEQVRRPVRFLDGIRTLEAQQVQVMLELGPHGTLTAMAADCVSTEPSLLASLRRDRPEIEAIFASLAQLHGLGYAVDWSAVFAPYAPAPIDLPSYRFQRTRHWRKPTVKDHSLAINARFPLAGHRFDLPDGSSLQQVLVGPARQPYLADHVVYDHIVVPGAFHVAILLAVSEARWPGQNLELRDIEFIRALTFADDRASTMVSVVLNPLPDGRCSAELFTEDPDQGWVQHVSANLGPSATIEPLQLRPDDAWAPAAAELDARLGQIQVDWGPRWHWLRGVQQLDGSTVLGRFEAPADVPTADAPLPGGLLDNSFALLIWSDSFTRFAKEVVPRLPYAIARLRWMANAAVPTHARFVTLDGSDGDGDGDVESNIDFFTEDGQRVVQVSGFRSRQAPAERFLPSNVGRDLYRVTWQPIDPGAGGDQRDWVLLGEDRHGVAASLPRPLTRLDALDDLPPGVAHRPRSIVVAPGGREDTPLARTRAALALLQAWLRHPASMHDRLLFVTQVAIQVELADRQFDLSDAPLWGLVRTAQSENPELDIALVDIDDQQASRAALGRLTDPAHRQIAIRRGEYSTPRIRRAEPPALALPDTGHWRLLPPTPRGELDGIHVVSHEPEALGANQVRVAIRAAGLNFRDVLNVLGMYPGDAGPFGGEGSGVVTEVGSAVTRWKPGDRVMGVLPWAFGDSSITDDQRLAEIPSGWSMAEAGTACAAYLTAYYALVELAGLRPKQRILIHAAAGGVGMAAVHLAHHLGAEVYATASPGKWRMLEELGIPPARIASSRNADFEAQFMAATGGQGVDVVLNSLAKELLDASLRVMARGGIFIEMGKTDLRDPARVREAHPSVDYRPFDLAGFDSELVGSMLAALSSRFMAGQLPPLPVHGWDIQHAADGFRFMAQARHVGKIALTMPPPSSWSGTVLLSGGTGALAGILARHLVASGRAKRLLLLSRRGLAAEGAQELADALTHAGADVTIAACDLANSAELAAVVAALPADAPLTAIFHLAGITDDATVTTLNDDKLERVFRAKVDTALNLCAVADAFDVSTFEVFSSAAGVLGTAGQANYAAANSLLDTMCALRRAQGRPSQSLAWGPWADVGMAAKLSVQDRERIARTGGVAIGAERGMALLDEAMHRPDATLVPVVLQTRSLDDHTPAILQDVLTRPLTARPSRPQPTDDLRRRLAATPADAQGQVLREALRQELAAVLGIADPNTIEVTRRFPELGLDSLTAVELRNRIQIVTGLRLLSTIVFEHDTLATLSDHLLATIAPDLPASAAPPTPADDDAMTAAIRAVRSQAPRPSQAGQEGRLLLELLRQALASEQGLSPALALIDALIAMRRQQPAPAKPLTATRLSRDSEALRIYAIPSLALPSTPLQYLRMASSWAAKASIWSAANPGYELGDPLVGGVSDLAQAHLPAAQVIGDGQGLLLLGYSSGAWVAMDLAARLEALGQPATGLVLLDPPFPAALRQDIEFKFLLRSAEYYLDNPQQYSTDQFITEFTAMRWNMQLYGSWQPPSLENTKTLYVHARGGFPGIGGDGVYTTQPHVHWRPCLPTLSVQDVEANHFELVTTGLDDVWHVLADWWST